MPSDVDPATLAHRVAVDVILDRYDAEAIDDLDVRTSFAGGELSIDVYLHVAGEDTAPVVNEAAERAATAVDDALADG